MDRKIFLEFDNILSDQFEIISINIIRFLILILIYRYGKYWVYKNGYSPYLSFKSKLIIIAKGIFASIVIGFLLKDLIDHKSVTSCITCCCVYLMGVVQESGIVRRGRSTFQEQ